ncbi:MAG: SDR family oxidoreductase [Planctomycetota bacterium]|jgi:NAD(P)-dependent dehydrogenase (short-subunit alcohol dehydrogenase family)
MSAPRVLITGGGRGIGRAIALRFAREGARVVVAARTSSELDEVAKEIDAAGGQGLAANMNVVDHGSVEAAVWRAVEFMDNGIDVLINNAGVFDVKSIHKMRPSDWSYQIDANLNGPFLVTTEALEYMEDAENPHIFNIASVAAQQGFAGSTAYCASKWGLRGFSEALREDLKDDGFRVTTVYPPSVDTTIFDNVEGDWDRSTMLKPEVIADAVWDAFKSETPVNDVTFD